MIYKKKIKDIKKITGNKIFEKRYKQYICFDDCEVIK
tara:strand:+ start:900 stop:1010 length:111 start_codon:yes stop_codon:yes gene_type:complete